MDEEQEPALRISGIHPATPAHPRKRLLPGDVAGSQLIVPTEVFSETMRRLEERSSRRRESAAVWSGVLTGLSGKVSRVDYHHELGDDRSGALYLELSEAAKFRLYGELAHSGLRLLALIHTHPAAWVGLSHVDRGNQVCSRVGFFSLVVPHYGRPPWQLRRIGVHVRTDSGWYTLRRREVRRMVCIRNGHGAV